MPYGRRVNRLAARPSASTLRSFVDLHQRDRLRAVPAPIGMAFLGQLAESLPDLLEPGDWAIERSARSLYQDIGMAGCLLAIIPQQAPDRKEPTSHLLRHQAIAEAGPESHAP
jgi:hypothetical protein